MAPTTCRWISQGLALIALTIAAAACSADADQGFAEASGEDIVGCPRPVEVVVYTESGTREIADALAANPSPCAHYFVSIPAVAGDKTQPRGGGSPEAVRALGPRMHAMAEFHWGGWSAWVAADSSRTWYEAGVEFRRRMAGAGYDIAAGDTWALNELPSSFFLADDSEHVREHARDAVRGLFEGPAGAPNVKGTVFSIGRGPEYQSALESLLRDAAFWNQMELHVRFWAPEVYTRPGQVCVGGTNVGTRSEHINAYIEHMPRLAEAGPDATDAARHFLEHAFVPLMNGVWGSDVYGTGSLTLEQMLNHVSTQVYAARSWATNHAYPHGRVGFAWAWHSDTEPEAGLQRVADRLASAIHGAYGAGGGRAAKACSPTGAYTYCQCDVAGARFDERWNAFATWN